MAEAGEVEETQQYTAAQMERMMKLQDVLLKAMAKKISWMAAAEIIGVTDRTTLPRPEYETLSREAARRA